MALTPKEARFVEEYLVDLNATQAAIRAGYAPRSADVTACRLLAKARISEAVGKAQAKRSERTAITQDRVLNELAAIGFSDIRKLFREDGGLKAFHSMEDSASASLAGVDVVEMAGGAKIGGSEGVQHIPMFTKKIKLWDKVKALELLGRHLAMFGDRPTGDDADPLHIEVTHRRATAPDAR